MIINVVLDVTDEILTKYFVFERYWEGKKKGREHQLFIYFRKVYDSVKRKVMYGITFSKNSVSPRNYIKISLSKTYTAVHIGQILFYAFPIQCGLKQVGAVSPLLLLLLYNMPLGESKKTEEVWNCMGNTAPCLC